MRDELDDHPEDYISLTYEDWCELMSTIEVKYEMKRAAVQIKNIASARAASLYDSEESVRIPRRNKAKTGVLCSNKYPKRAHARYHGVNRYCVLCKKEGTNEQKYTSHSAEDCTGVRTKLPIKYGIGVPMGNRTNDVQQYKKSENKRKKYLKALNKQNKMLYSIAKKSGLLRDIKNIKNIKSRASKKTRESSSDDLDSDLSLSSDSR